MVGICRGNMVGIWGECIHIHIQEHAECHKEYGLWLRQNTWEAAPGLNAFSAHWQWLLVPNSSAVS